MVVKTKKAETNGSTNGNGEPATKGRKRKVGSWPDDPGREAVSAAHLEALESEESKVAKPIDLPKLEINTAELKLVSDSELICNRWSEKAVQMMLDKQVGKASAGKQKKDPIADFLSSLYTIEKGKVVGSYEDMGEDDHPAVQIKGGKFGFPTIAFKCAAVEACTSLGKSVITKVAARQCFHIKGELAEILGTPRMRRDMVRVGMGTADVRFRAGFKEWSTVLQIRYNARVLSISELASLFNTAGFAVGIGEHRSECDGQNGLFHVE